MFVGKSLNQASLADDVGRELSSFCRSVESDQSLEDLTKFLLTIFP